MCIALPSQNRLLAVNYFAYFIAYFILLLFYFIAILFYCYYCIIHLFYFIAYFILQCMVLGANTIACQQFFFFFFFFWGTLFLRKHLVFDLQFVAVDLDTKEILGGTSLSISTRPKTGGPSWWDWKGGSSLRAQQQSSPHTSSSRRGTALRSEPCVLGKDYCITARANVISCAVGLR